MLLQSPEMEILLTVTAAKLPLAMLMEEDECVVDVVLMVAHRCSDDMCVVASSCFLASLYDVGARVAVMPDDLFLALSILYEEWVSRV